MLTSISHCADDALSFLIRLELDRECGENPCYAGGAPWQTRLSPTRLNYLKHRRCVARRSTCAYPLIIRDIHKKHHGLHVSPRSRFYAPGFAEPSTLRRTHNAYLL